MLIKQGQFEFSGFQFFPEECLLLRLADRHQFHLTPQQSELLGLLLSNPGELVTYAEIRQALWPAAGPRVKLGPSIREVKYGLAKYLGKQPALLETINGRGYRLNAAVTRLDALEQGERVSRRAETSSAKSPEEILAVSQLRSTVGARKSWFAGHTAHVLVGCGLYAALYAEAIFLEISYQYDQFDVTAWKTAPWAFGWIFITSLAAVMSASGRKRKPVEGIVRPALILIGSALVLYLVLSFVLPTTQITKATFQTYTAHGAYLKDTSYFLALGIVFLLLPFYLVNYDKAEAGHCCPPAIKHLRVRHLVLLLCGAAVFSFWSMSHLLDNLVPAPHMDLFVTLAEWRRILYFSLGLECIVWYYLQTRTPSGPATPSLIAAQSV